MLYLVVHIFVEREQAEAFHKYESQVLPIFKSHGGKILAAIRTEALFPAVPAEQPYEIHVLTIPSEEAFLAYRQDPGVVALVEIRKRVIRRMELFKSTQAINY